mgnify:FL=1
MLRNLGYIETVCSGKQLDAFSVYAKRGFIFANCGCKSFGVCVLL